jgi:hypothetical protein
VSRKKGGAEFSKEEMIKEADSGGIEWQYNKLAVSLTEQRWRSTKVSRTVTGISLKTDLFAEKRESVPLLISSFTNKRSPHSK